MKSRQMGHLASAALLVLVAAAADDQSGKDLDYLVKYVVQSTVPRVRADCARDLGRLGPAAKPASHALCRAMLDPAKQVRAAAGDALEKVNPDLYWPVRTLLSDEDIGNHAKAAAALAKLGKESKPAIGILVHYLHAGLAEYEMIRIRSRLIELAAQARADQAVITERDELEQILAKLLAQAGNRLQKPADDGDLQAMQEERKTLLKTLPAVMGALAIVAPDEPATVKALALALHANESSFQLAGLEMLAKIGREHPTLSAQVATSVVPCLKSKSADVRLEAVRSLAGLGPEGGRGLSSLKRLRDHDPSSEVREAAANLLEELDKN